MRRLSIAALGCALVAATSTVIGLAPVAQASTAPSPATPTTIFTEDFENNPTSGQVAINTYTGAGGRTYTADSAWVGSCNGYIVYGNYPSAVPGCGADVSSGFNPNVRALAARIGRLYNASTQNENRALTAYTQNDPGAEKVMMETSGISVPNGSTGRFVTFSVDVGVDSCEIPGAKAPLLKFYLLNGTTEVATFSSAINACTDTPANLITEPGNVGRRAGTFAANGSFLLTSNTIGVRLRNAEGSGAGNDGAIDNIRVLDATPTLSKDMGAAATNGSAQRLTFTITNTTELAAKTGWGFVDTLPAGLTVANPNGFATTCNGGAMTALPGSGTVSVVGGSLSAGVSACTFTVDVIGANNTSYSNTSSNMALTALNFTGSATTTFAPPPTAVNDTAATPLNTAVSPDVTTNDIAQNGATLVSAALDGKGVTSVPVTGGTFTNGPGAKQLTFTPTGGFTGTSGAATYRVTDSDGRSSTATITVVVGSGSQTITAQNVVGPIASATRLLRYTTDGLSGNPVVVASSTPSVCTAGSQTTSPVTITFPFRTTSATCTLTLNQAGGNGFTAASTVTQTFTVIPPDGALAPSTTGATPALTPHLVYPAQAGTDQVLTYYISNTPGNAAKTGLFFTQTPPSGLALSSGNPFVSSTCGGNISGAGGAISLINGSLAAGVSQCAIQLNVIAAPGTYTITPGAFSNLIGLEVAGGETRTFGAAATMTADTASINVGQISTRNVLTNDTAGSNATFDVASTRLLEAGEPVTSISGFDYSFVLAENTSTVTFTPSSSFSGTASATYRVTDSNGLSWTSTFTVTVSKQNDSISVTPPATGTAGGTGTVTYSAGSGTGDVTFTPDNASICTFGSASDGSVTVTYLTAGTCSFTANKAADNAYNAASATGSITVNVTATTLTINDVTNTGYNQSSTITYASNSPAAVTLTSSTPSTCSVTGTTLLILTGNGSCTIHAAQPATSLYGLGSADRTITLHRLTPTVNLSPGSTTAYGQSFTASATTSSDAPVVYTSDTPSVCAEQVPGSHAFQMLTGTGTCTLRAAVAQNDRYEAASATTSFSASKLTPTLSIAAIDDASKVYGQTFTPSASSASTGAITFSPSGSCAAASGSPGVVEITSGMGSCEILASQQATNDYESATANVTFSTVKATPTLAFAAVDDANKAFGATFTPSATSVSNGLVTYLSVTGSSCQPSANPVAYEIVSGSGSCQVDAYQSSTDNYNSSGASLSFSVSKLTPTLTFSAVADISKVYGQSFTPSANSASTGAVTYTAVTGSSCNPDPSSTTLFQITSGIGQCWVQASQAATDDYTAATADLKFNTVRADAVLAFADVLATQKVFGASFTPSASSGSEGEVTYTPGSGSACLPDDDDASVYDIVTGTGTCTVNASQAQTSDHNAATATLSFTVSKATPTLVFDSVADANKVFGQSFTLSASSASTGTVTYSANSGSVCLPSEDDDSIYEMGSGTGSCSVHAAQAATANYNAATADLTFAAVRATPTLAFASVADASKVYGQTFTPSASSASTGAVTYTASTPSVCALASGSSTLYQVLSGNGTCTVHAAQAQTSNYEAATADLTFSTVRATPTLVIGSVADANKVFGRTFTATATSASTGTVTFSTESTACTATGTNGTTITMVAGTGSCVLDASQAQSANHSAATAQLTFSASKASATITFAAGSTSASMANTGGLVRTATSTDATRPIAYSTVGLCEVTATGTVTVNSAGTCVVTAAQAANADFTATSATHTISVQQSVATVPMPTPTPTPTQTPEVEELHFITLPATVSEATDTYDVKAKGSNTERPITYAIDPSTAGVCTINGTIVTFLISGDCIVVATQLGEDGHPPVTTRQTVSVTKKPQVLRFTTKPPAKPRQGGTYVVKAEGGRSGEPIKYGLSPRSTGCVLSKGNVLKLTGKGHCIVTATQDGTDAFSAAAPIFQEFDVKPELRELIQTSKGGVVQLSTLVEQDLVGCTTQFFIYSGMTDTVVAIGTAKVGKDGWVRRTLRGLTPGQHLLIYAHILCAKADPAYTKKVAFIVQ